jgi:signal transduction histidine kinase
MALEPVQRTFLLIAGAVLIITIGIGFLISQSITRPIAALVKGTAEVSKGNYDIQLEVPSGKELKFLAKQFQDMSRSLKEKVRQLADRNRDLENALQKLEETQEELVKSERLAATGRLTAQLSHEINNPIHNVLSCLQTALKRTSASSADRELIEVAHEEMERLARLTKQLLNVYRSSVTQPEQCEQVSIHTIISDVLASSAEMLRETGIETKVSLCTPPPAVMGSPDKLKQVFIHRDLCS